MIKVIFAALMVATIAIFSCALPDMPAFYIDMAEEGVEIAEQGTEDDSGVPGIYNKVTIAADQFVLRWDPPEGQISNYRIYYREHGTEEWIFFQEISAGPEPEYVFADNTFHGMEFDLAVSSVNASDNESELHTSLDSSAEPPEGWYIFWDK